MKINQSRPRHLAIALLACLVAWAVVIGGGAAVADKLIGSKDIRDGSIRKVDLRPGVQAQLERKGQPGKTGAQGPKGDTGAAGTPAPTVNRYWSVAYYDVGDTNAGAIATVACLNQTDEAISGGVQTLGLDGGNPAVISSSFPGRMNWGTMKPREQRTDGWIVQFDDDQAPLKVKIWALCENRDSQIGYGVVPTYTQSAG